MSSGSGRADAELAAASVLLSSIPPHLPLTRRLPRSHLPFLFREDIKEAAADWGLECLRYEIKDINVPAGIKAAMELQVGTFAALLASQQQGSAAWGLHALGCWSGTWCRYTSACLNCLHKAMHDLQVVGHAGAVCVRAVPFGHSGGHCSLGYWGMHLLGARSSTGMQTDTLQAGFDIPRVIPAC